MGRLQGKYFSLSVVYVPASKSSSVHLLQKVKTIVSSKFLIPQGINFVVHKRKISHSLNVLSQQKKKSEIEIFTISNYGKMECIQFILLLLLTTKHLAAIIIIMIIFISCLDSEICSCCDFSTKQLCCGFFVLC